jgi:hypothetical protein
LVILCLLTISVGHAQQPKPDSVATDTVKNRYLPTGLRIGTDAFALVKSEVRDNFNGWEVNADVDFDRYFLAFDYGAWSRSFPNDTAGYSNDGKYWRAGVDVNFLKKDPERNMFFLGFRYGRAKFSEQMNISAEDPIWGVVAQDYVNTDVNARWLELTAGIRVKIWKMIWLGYTGRLKFGLKTDEKGAMLPHDVPGYGRTDREIFWGFNYQIFVRIPFRKMPPLPPYKK